jgi:hypothetical protein
VAGTVYDPAVKEVVIGAAVTLAGDAGTFAATTDNYGDFWLDGLPNADFTLTIEGDGRSTSIPVSTKEKDIGLKDIPL